MGKRSLFLIVLTLFCLVEEIKAVTNIICHEENLFSNDNDVKMWCKPDYIMYNPVKIDKIESSIKESLKDRTLEEVVEL